MNEVSREQAVLEAFATLADTLVAGYDVVDLLQTLVDTCADALDVTAVGLLLVDPDAGALEVVASTSEESRIVETMQLGAEAGPCIECFETSKVVVVPDIARVPSRWSAFRDSAIELGFAAVAAVPLHLRTDTIGALNLFSDRVGELNRRDLRAAQALADVATIGILHERTVRAGDVLHEQLQGALSSRVVIEQAKGVLAQTHGVGMDEAFAMLRSYARERQRSLAEVSRALVERSLIF
jgi:transcriptional regulator with GAF, ATPase, and Fis domain